MPLSRKQRQLVLMVVSVAILAISSVAYAGDIRITIPKRSRLTPVQKLNREGVEAVRKHNYDKAKELFYKAYLFDPGDPFTLNNLGYVAELEGEVERAHNFYDLANGHATEALIDRASSSKLEGTTLQNAIGSIQTTAMQINRDNVNAVRLLSQGRIREADAILRQALRLDPQDAFTLNNMAVALEAQGEYTQALQYYTAAANAHTSEPVIVTMNAATRGKPVSQLASESVDRLRTRMRNLQNTDSQVALLNLRGVSALNRNEWRDAWAKFSQAYKLDPTNAFTLNNQGYIAEMNGDLESAQEYYREARVGGKATAPVGLATRAGAEGMKLFDVAQQSGGAVSGAIEYSSEKRRRNAGPIQLKRRDGTPAVPGPEEPAPSPQ